MTLVAATAVPSSVGFDCDVALTQAGVGAIKLALGATFALRYVSRSIPEPGSDLTADELGALTSAGLGVIAIQHAHLAGWTPSGALGVEDGAAMVANLRAIGYPPASAVVDFEGCGAATTAQQAVEYLNNWYEVVAAGGFAPGPLYVGAQSVLSAAQLYRDLIFDRYYKSASDVPSPIKRGFCMLQTTLNDLVAEIPVDLDSIVEDNLGGLPKWAVPG